VALVESYYYIEVNNVSGVDLVKLSSADNPISNTPIQTLVLEGKIFDKIEKIIKIPRFRVYNKVLEDIPRSHPHNYAAIPSALLTKAMDTQHILAFHL
jgi:hypothetical protein